MKWFKNKVAWGGTLYFADTETLEQWLDMMSESGYACKVSDVETDRNGHINAQIELYS